MRRANKFTLKYILAVLLTTALIFPLTWKTNAVYASPSFFCSTLTTQQDTTKPIRPLTKSLSDTTGRLPGDTSPIVVTDTFSLKLSKDTLDAPVKYEAEDSAVVMVADKKIILYGKTKTDYKDIELRAPKVELNQETQILTAVNSVDSTGDIIERAHFKQGDQEFQSDTIQFNFKTQKGLTKNTYTNQNEIFIQAEYAKKVGGDIMYAKNGVLTTCSLDDPHFGFHFNKIKVINKKIAVTGAIRPEFEHVPIPLFLPFGIFPMNQGRHSGLLPPQFTTNEQYGVGLEGLGYYQVLNQYFDVTVRGNIYSYGGWSLNVLPTYRKRYKYNGALGFNILTTKLNFKGDPDFVKNKSFNVTWSHRVDSRARPGTNFSASVNAGSTSYNRYLPNGASANFNNTLTSSIAYSKTWQGKPYNLTVTAGHNQNNNLHLINVNLPDVGFTVTTLYPFQKKDISGTPKWYEKLGIAYNGTLRNQVAFYDTVQYGKNGNRSFTDHLLDTLQWGAQHNIPITLSLPPILGGSIVVSPGVSYSQVWISQKFFRKWNSAKEKVDTVINKGFFIDQQTSFSLGLSTALFGTYNFKPNKKIMAIRHVIRPTISFGYRPDLSGKHWYATQIDTTGRKFRFSEFEGALYSGYGEGRSGSIGFGIDNNLEMKVRSKNDTTEEGKKGKKIRLIDGLGFSGSYNLLADSFALSPFNLNLRSTLFDKISITASATLNPYDYDAQGFAVDKLFRHNGKFTMGRITNAYISMSTQFQSKPKDEKKDEARKKAIKDRLNDPALQADQQRLMDYMRQNPAEFVDFNIPWSVNLGFSLNYYQQFKRDYSGFESKFSANANFGGTFNLTPKWNFSANGYYDLDTKKLQTFQMNISRDLHCWQMSISVTPIGLYRFFSININPKSTLLQDLKVNRTKYFTSY